MHDLTQAPGDMFGNLGFKLLYLDIDLQFAETGMAVGDGGMPACGDKIAFGEQFKNTRHHIGFCGGVNGETINGFGRLRAFKRREKGMIGHDNAHTFSLYPKGEKTRPGVLRPPGW